MTNGGTGSVFLDILTSFVVRARSDFVGRSRGYPPIRNLTHFKQNIHERDTKEQQLPSLSKAGWEKSKGTS